ncbi:MAG TPA: adenylate/guanylate cyclase domain-containing protein [Candidatus Limnocylindria bacterium]
MTPLQKPAHVQRASLSEADVIRRFGHGTGQFVQVGNVTVGRGVLEPGWRWSTDVKPLVDTPSCQVHHLHVQLSERFAIRMDDGSEHEFAANDVMDIPPGHDAWVVGDEQVVLLDISGNSATFALPAERPRFVATLLFTDIVGSIQRLAELGDAAWRQVLERHNRVTRQQLERFGGREVVTTGDGFLASFDSAAAALRCALALSTEVAGIGLEIRAGVHTGEVERVGEDLRGLAVHAAARIMAEAGASEVLTSAVTRALAADAPVRFTPRGERTLKGLPGPMELYVVDPA